MTQDPDEKPSSPMDDKLAGALALAIAKNPRANLQQIARGAGISKATLYRLSPTREGLVEVLMERTNQHLRNALTQAELDRPPFRDALKRLTENVMTVRSFYLFWCSTHWMRMLDSGEMVGDSTPELFGEALEEFFLKGQQAGAFRIDIPAKWLATSYDFLLYAAIEAAQRGEIAPVGMASLVDKILLDGALAQRD